MDTEYKPVNGYFDLTEKPKGMSAKIHRQTHEQQMLLIGEAEKYRDPKVREDNWLAFEKLRYYMAELQQIISRWPHEMIFR